jgi:hypothetical protein
MDILAWLVTIALVVIVFAYTVHRKRRARE